MNPLNTKFTVALLLLIACTASHAQRMYRCGNTYQQTPCEGASAGKEIRNFGGSATVSVAMDRSANECKQRGIDSQKIIWAREAGALSERQITDLAGKGFNANQLEEQRNLIASVYQKRGSAPEIRASIEADCVLEKKQAEEALALAAILAKQRKEGTQPNPVAAATPQVPSASQSEANTKAETQQRDAQCKSLATQIQDVRNEQRAGGSVSVMESLNQRQRNLENDRTRAHCP